MVGINQVVARTLGNPLVLVFLFLQCLDALTTSLGLAVGAVELNHLGAQWFGVVGANLGPASLKVMGALVLLGVLARIQLRWPQERLHWQLLVGVNAFYMLVVLNNLRIVVALS